MNVLNFPGQLIYRTKRLFLGFRRMDGGFRYGLRTAAKLNHHRSQLLHSRVNAGQEMAAFIRKSLHFLLLFGFIGFKHKLRIQIKHFGYRMKNRQPLVWKHLPEMGGRQIQIKHIRSQIPLRR